MATPPGQGNLFEQPLAESSGLIERSLPLSAELLRRWQERIHQFQAPLFSPQLAPQLEHRNQQAEQQQLCPAEHPSSTTLGTNLDSPLATALQ